jgi:hypothetical protein
VKSALRILDREQMVVSRQGSGVFVRSRRGTSLDLRELLRSAFDRPHVGIDYAGFRGETLSHVLPDALDVVREGRTELRSLRMRMLLVDPVRSSGMPVPTEDGENMRAVRPALVRLTRQAVDTVTAAVRDLTESGLARSASVEVRVHSLGPSFKAYILNDERVLFGFYPAARYSMTVGSTRGRTGRPVELHHPSGWETTLFGPDDRTGVDTTSTSAGPPFHEQARAWFDSVWSTIGREYPS